jgi:hypothetical protein
LNKQVTGEEGHRLFSPRVRAVLVYHGKVNFQTFAGENLTDLAFQVWFRVESQPIGHRERLVSKEISVCNRSILRWFSPTTFLGARDTKRAEELPLCQSILMSSRCQNWVDTLVLT